MPGAPAASGAVQADGRLRVGQDLQVDGDDAAGAGQLPEFLREGLMTPRSCMECLAFLRAYGLARVRAACGGYSPRLPTTAASSRPSKQVVVPVWQAAPTWSTRDQQGVAVAVQGHGLHELEVAGGVALAPIFLA